MFDSYKYVDLDYTYTDPETGALRNLADITDPDVLLFFESGAVAKRIQELYEKPFKIKGADSLLSIHRHLFQDVYSWAGKRRKVEISKAGKQFFPTSHLALEKGLTLNLNPADNKNVYDQYMQGTINSDVKTLTKLILALIQ
jgi:fido (protein-threonine AMPylation protein)